MCNEYLLLSVFEKCQNILSGCKIAYTRSSVLIWNAEYIFSKKQSVKYATCMQLCFGTKNANSSFTRTDNLLKDNE